MNEWQGKRKVQVEFSEKMVVFCWTAVTLLVVVAVIVKLIRNLL